MAPAPGALGRLLAPLRRVTPDHRIRAQVFLAGAGVMVLEMLAGRLLAPRFGSTLYTWGALIGVVMTALALGYYAGGRMADRWPRPLTLSAVLAAGAGFAMVLPLFAPPALAAVAGAFPDPRAGPLVASLLLIAPPSLVLGAATPVAVRLLVPSMDRAGRTAGAMAGVSTAGSILGTFGTVFVLVPAFDVAAILLGTGALLGLASLLHAEHRGSLAGVLAILLVLSPLGQAALAPALRTLATGLSGDVVYQKSTPYHELYVVDDGAGVRTLVLDGNRHSSMYLDRPNETNIRYVEYFHLGPLLNPNASRALFIGGGGLSGPKQFLAAYPQMQVDVVELDPDVVAAAFRYFAVPADHPRLNVTVADGRQFLQRSSEQWDVIVLDAYGRTYVPFHLMTAEFLALVREHLAPGGVVVSNVIGSSEGATSLLLRSEARTMGAVFPWTRAAFTRPGLEALVAQNVMLVAAEEEPPGHGDAAGRAPAWRELYGRDYPGIVANLRAGGLRTDDVALLTDAFAPVETYVSPLTLGPYDPSG